MTVEYPNATHVQNTEHHCHVGASRPGNWQGSAPEAASEKSLVHAALNVGYTMGLKNALLHPMPDDLLVMRRSDLVCLQRDAEQLLETIAEIERRAGLGT